ncbi:MAG: hypothetical protein AAGE18_01020 [Pseudomonadota bacterium]
MAGPTKIATCCYCGTRAALVLDKGRHELACSACGAPLHSLKQIPSGRAEGAKPSPRPKKRAPEYERRRPKKRKRKSFFDRLEDVWDEIEDIFD